MYARVVRRTLTLGLVLLVLGPAAAAGDGGPVRSFGAGGSVSFAPQRFSSSAGVVVDAQGRTLVGATLDDGSLLRTRAAVLRLLPSGALDPSFGSGGMATIAPPPPYSTTRAEAIALDAQGRIVIAGEVDDDVPAVARLLADGTLDPGFASGGLLIASGAYGGLPGGWKSVAVAGSSIVVAGAVDGAPPFGTSLGRIAVVARITDNGRPDAAFAAGGFLQVPIAGVTFASTHAVAIDRRGGSCSASGARPPSPSPATWLPQSSASLRRAAWTAHSEAAAWSCSGRFRGTRRQSASRAGVRSSRWADGQRRPRPS